MHAVSSPKEDQGARGRKRDLRQARAADVT